MRTYSFSLLLITLFAFSCQDKGGNEMAQLHEEVMDVHDEIMPRHEKLLSYQARLEDSLKQMNAEGRADSATLVHYHQTIAKLDTAIEGMDDWMHNWDSDYDQKEKTEALAYLNEQKKIIKKVKQDFQEGEKAAKELLNE